MEEVQSAFATYGEVKDCFVPLDYDGNPRGFAFVLMDEENALAAIEGLDGTELGGRSLNVKKSLPKGEKAVAKGKPWYMKYVCVCVCLLIIRLFSYYALTLSLFSNTFIHCF